MTVESTPDDPSNLGADAIELGKLAEEANVPSQLVRLCVAVGIVRMNTDCNEHASRSELMWLQLAQQLHSLRFPLGECALIINSIRVARETSGEVAGDASKLRGARWFRSLQSRQEKLQQELELIDSILSAAEPSGLKGTAAAEGWCA